MLDPSVKPRAVKRFRMVFESRQLRPKKHRKSGPKAQQISNGFSKLGSFRRPVKWTLCACPLPSGCFSAAPRDLSGRPLREGGFITCV